MKPQKTSKAPTGYRAIINVRDPSKGPVILAECTSIEWPRGWKQKDADRWRNANGLMRR